MGDVVATEYAFVALKFNGKVVSWEDPSCGRVYPNLQSEVTHIVANNYSFVALKFNGKVFSWGFCKDFINVKDQLKSGVIKIEVLPDSNNFRATKRDGSQIEWN